jgi:chromosome segregation ATPase
MNESILQKLEDFLKEHNVSEEKIDELKGQFDADNFNMADLQSKLEKVLKAHPEIEDPANKAKEFVGEISDHIKEAAQEAKDALGV